MEDTKSYIVPANGKIDLVNTDLDSKTVKTLKIQTGVSSHILCIDVDNPKAPTVSKLLDLISPNDCFVVSSQYTLDDVINQRCRFKILYRYNSEKELSNPRTKRDENGNTIPQPIEIFYNSSKKVSVIGARHDGYEYVMYNKLTDIHFDLQDIVDYKINFKLVGKQQGNSKVTEKREEKEKEDSKFIIPTESEDVDPIEFTQIIMRLMGNCPKVTKKNNKLLTFPCLFPEAHTKKNNAYAFKVNGYYVCRCQGIVCESEYYDLNEAIKNAHISTQEYDFKGFDINNDSKVNLFLAYTGFGKTEKIAEECVKAIQENRKLLVVLQSKEAIERLKGRINYKTNGALPTFEMTNRIFTWVSENNDNHLDDNFTKSNVILTHHYYLSNAGDVLTYYPSLMSVLDQQNLEIIVDEAHTWLELCTQLTMEIGGLYNNVVGNRFIENREQLTREQYEGRKDRLHNITKCLEPTLTDFGTIELRKQYKVYNTLDYIDLAKEIDDRFAPVVDYKLDDLTEYKLYKNKEPKSMKPNNLDDCNDAVNLLLDPCEYVLVSKIIGDETPRRTIGRTMATFHHYWLLNEIITRANKVLLTTATFTDYHYNILDRVTKYEITTIQDPIKKIQKVVLLTKNKDTRRRIRKQVLESLNETNARALIFMPTIDNARDLVINYDNMMCCDNGWYSIGKRVSQEDYIDNFKRNVIVCGLESSVSKGYNFAEEVGEKAEGFDIVYFDNEPVSPDILKKYINKEDKIVDYYDTYAMTTFTQAIGRALRKEKEQLTICLNNISDGLVKAIIDYIKNTLECEVVVDELNMTNLKISTVKDIVECEHDLSESYLYKRLYLGLKEEVF